jgi:group II intron reverse transcriptase/maturase
VWRPDVLAEAWKRVRKSRGAPGVDGKTLRWIEDYGEDRYLAELGAVLQAGDYQPGLIRRTFIPKGDGRQRPLGIPTVTDRVVQMAVKWVIEPLFEADFLPCSFGYRPKRRSHDAIGVIDEHLRRGYRWVVDVDLKSYFDTLPHDRLLALVQRRVTDRKLIRLIRKWLKAGILEEGEVMYPELGSPQGGVLSPLLANIYLHEVDREWQSRGPQAVLVRYADDMLILCPSQQVAEREYAHLQVGLVRHACMQLRIYLRRKYGRKRSQYTRRWPDRMFHATYGLLTVTELLHGRRSNAYA